MTRLRRFALIGILLVALFGLGVYSDATAENRWPYPSNEQLASNYERYVGQEALLFGTVERVDGPGARISVQSDAGTFEMDVRSFDVSVQSGGTVQVYGTLVADNTITATQVVVVNPAAGSNLYKYAISAVAVGIFLVAFFRHWRLDVRGFTLEARDG